MQREELHNIIPNIRYTRYQCYILHINNAGMGVIHHEKGSVEDIILGTGNEIYQVKIERNSSGLNDYRILCRKS